MTSLLLRVQYILQPPPQKKGMKNASHVATAGPQKSGYLHLSTATNGATFGELQLVLQSKTSTRWVGQAPLGQMLGHRVVRNRVSIYKKWEVIGSDDDDDHSYPPKKITYPLHSPTNALVNMISFVVGYVSGTMASCGITQL